jgi:hypothetical protein
LNILEFLKVLQKNKVCQWEEIKPTLLREGGGLTHLMLIM